MATDVMRAQVPSHLSVASRSARYFSLLPCLAYDPPTLITWSWVPGFSLRDETLA